MLAQKNIVSLQALRGLAAILVVLCHFEIALFGFTGVDIFFVLSGFIIYFTSYNNINLTPKKFLIRRFIRIFPMYWIALFSLFSFFVATKLFPAIFVSNNVVFQEVQVTGLAEGLTQAVTAFFLIPTNTPLIAVSWTLSFEIIFYLIFGLLFFSKPKLLLGVLCGWVVFCYIFKFILHIPSVIFNSIVFEFLCGIIAAKFFLKASFRYSLFILIIGIILFITSIFFTESSEIRELAYGLPSAFIIFGLANLDMRIPRLFIFLGDSSYSIYLFHNPLHTFLLKTPIYSLCVSEVGKKIGEFFPLFLVILLCCCIHYFIEKPLINFFKRRINH